MQPRHVEALLLRASQQLQCVESGDENADYLEQLWVHFRKIPLRLDKKDALKSKKGSRLSGNWKMTRANNGRQNVQADAEVNVGESRGSSKPDQYALYRLIVMPKDF
jgi:hypothetical protein